MLITLEPHWIFGSNFSYLFILICPDTVMQNRDKGLPSIILVSRGLLVKMLINLEAHGILYSNFAY